MSTARSAEDDRIARVQRQADEITNITRENINLSHDTHTQDTTEETEDKLHLLTFWFLGTPLLLVLRSLQRGEKLEVMEVRTLDLDQNLHLSALANF